MLTEGCKMVKQQKVRKRENKIHKRGGTKSKHII